MYNPGNWMMVPRPFLRLLNAQSGILLAYLGDAADKYESSPYTTTPDELPKEHGWFVCPLRRIAEEMGTSERTIKRWFQDLVKTKVIEVRRKGFDNVRWLRVNWDEVDRLMEQLEERAQKQRRVQ